jgi:HSP20 family protein
VGGGDYFRRGKEANIMANLIKRENRDVTRSASPELRLDPFRMMDALLRWDPFRGDWGGSNPSLDFVPRFDVKETKEAYVITADLPGVRDDELDVSLSGNMLTISGKREDEHREEGETYYAMERSYGTFARTFTLPDGGDARRAHPSGPEEARGSAEAHRDRQGTREQGESLRLVDRSCRPGRAAAVGSGGARPEPRQQQGGDRCERWKGTSTSRAR